MKDWKKWKFHCALDYAEIERDWERSRVNGHQFKMYVFLFASCCCCCYCSITKMSANVNITWQNRVYTFESMKLLMYHHHTDDSAEILGVSSLSKNITNEMIFCNLGASKKREAKIGLLIPLPIIEIRFQRRSEKKMHQKNSTVENKP